MACKVTNGGVEVHIENRPILNNDKNKIKNPELNRAKKILTNIKENQK